MPPKKKEEPEPEPVEKKDPMDVRTASAQRSLPPQPRLFLLPDSPAHRASRLLGQCGLMNFLADVKATKEGIDSAADGFGKVRRTTRELAAQYEAMTVAVSEDWAKLAKREGAEYTDAELSEAFSQACDPPPPAQSGCPTLAPSSRSTTRTAAATSTGQSSRGCARSLPGNRTEPSEPNAPHCVVAGAQDFHGSGEHEEKGRRQEEAR